MSDEQPPTPAEVQRVRAYECAVRGHSYTHIEAVGRDGPAFVVCDRCGKSWPVGGEPIPPVVVVPVVDGQVLPDESEMLEPGYWWVRFEHGAHPTTHFERIQDDGRADWRS